MLVTLEEVKLYLRLETDYDGEDTILTLMINNAEAYIENAGIIIDETNAKQVNLAKLLALVLITDFYENRELTGKSSEKVRYIVQSMIAQLQYCYGADT
ncbi:head-tail connector protein [Wukongibacter sp. M2B1]|uniref:head-tail connector protein n=1 Tax=Wukongibacter sp. M2B1 TaxID=3088895 RepID=UPI003D7BC587